MDTKHYKIAIIGAGPSGATCANTLALNNIKDIILIDRHTFPRDKTCGDGLGPGVIDIVRKINLLHIFDDYSPIELISISSPSGKKAEGLLPEINGSKPIGYTIPRIEFDNHLFQAAKRRGVNCLLGYKLGSAKFVDGVWHLSLQNGTKTKNITADIVIGADGARSKVRRELHIPMNSDRHTGIGARIYAKNSSKKPLNALQLDFIKPLLPAYGWIFPIDQNNVNVGIGIDLDNYKKNKVKITELLEIYKNSIRGQADLKYELDTYSSHILPYGSELPRISVPEKNAALIGDAASMINPLTGEGVFYGMYAGNLLGFLLSDSLNNGGNYQGALKKYSRQFIQKFHSHYKTNWIMKEKVENIRWCEMVINACSKDKQTLSNLINIMMGDKKNIDASTILKIIIKNIIP